MEGTIGEIRLFAGNFAPRAWEFCQGQLIAISENDALFSVIGTTYGGDGQVTFALPNYSGRLALGVGQGPGLSSYEEGQTGGSESVTILPTQLPMHIHNLQGTVQTGAGADGSSPGGTYPATATTDIYAESPNGGTMAPGIVKGVTTAAGNNQPLPIIKPYLAINVIICTEGIYPSRP